MFALLLSRNAAHARQGFIARNQLNFARLNLRDPPADFLDVCVFNFWRDIICQARDKALREFNPRFRR